MRIAVVTLFPEVIRQYTGAGLLGKACARGDLAVDAVDLRAYASNRHHKVDDRVFGGGAGMLLACQPLFSCVEDLRKRQGGRVVLLSAYGTPFRQDMARALAADDALILLCGRYEGLDQRAIDVLVDHEISIGPYVLMGGELPALVVLEALARMIPGVIGNPESVETDSHYEESRMGWPQFTQPRLFRGLGVPSVLRGGHHAEIEAWRDAERKTPGEGRVIPWTDELPGGSNE